MSQLNSDENKSLNRKAMAVLSGILGVAIVLILWFIVYFFGNVGFVTG